MSEAVSALAGKSSSGFVTVAEAGLQGMITLRADLSAPATAEAVRAVTGLDLPAPRRVTSGGTGAVLWMSPDELLILVPHAEAPAAVARLDESLAGAHHLAVEVSDARALFTVTGAAATDALRKLAPVDFDAMDADEVRRSRFAQVAAATWKSGADEWSVVCFRSVAAYVFGCLANAARSGSDL
ncbi:sarcosine oxidase subunit gamma [Frigidibacter sp. MR17.24]|uniref:sarcosine oxidase subunit gamma n=1 Tax=Frigidibacter sp. MR17.24 TaxID=3127345 RepID=UPI0030130711